MFLQGFIGVSWLSWLGPVLAVLGHSPGFYGPPEYLVFQRWKTFPLFRARTCPFLEKVGHLFRTPDNIVYTVVHAAVYTVVYTIVYTIAQSTVFPLILVSIYTDSRLFDLPEGATWALL